MNTRKLTFSAMLIATGTILGNIIYIPVGASKCFPVQHAINVISAVLLGPWYALSNAFLISLLRNILGTGSLLAFPGSMIGAFLAGVVFKRTGSKLFASIGEVFGTGILGGIAAYPVAKFVVGKDAAVLFYVVPFLISTIGGSIIGYVLVSIFEKNEMLKKLTA
ncbi:energy coupling factor transporter S component ThiW [Fonticella tunisiensis]|uniref:Energy coupling factor transporter S component ThiW n=1 Tax=Fonticella tunisiensis TaxID=1096341 RepID=A0A4R7KPU2_9CLOT|nr:energy coupling factor transporter S component ThiW [Fonticella tunisiensis]TDT57269.1 energy coupling factor transporter S component ThiW [Fonticella tunisiensis]